MSEAFRAFAEELIDYAGLFPPAGLPFEEAVANYLRYRRQPEAWMLGRFICPVTRLPELEQIARDLPADEGPLRVSALATAAPAPAAFLPRLQDDLSAIAAAHRRSAARLRVEAVEARVPEGGPSPAPAAEEPWAELFRDASSRLRAVCGEVPLYLEASWGEGGRPGLDAVVRALGLAGPGVGLKLRCGGLVAEAFPTPEQLARALVEARRANVAVKATAGLHHPLRAWRAEVGTKMHGFINLFAAALLADAFPLGEEEVCALLREEDPASFRFTAEALHWGDRRIGAAGIRARRRTRITSFGSCSFEEPRDDLRGLGLLPAAE